MGCISDSIGTIAAALAKTQAELANRRSRFLQQADPLPRMRRRPIAHQGHGCRDTNFRAPYPQANRFAHGADRAIAGWLTWVHSKVGPSLVGAGRVASHAAMKSLPERNFKVVTEPAALTRDRLIEATSSSVPLHLL
jgi:hypothetical protein